MLDVAATSDPPCSRGRLLTFFGVITLSLVADTLPAVSTPCFILVFFFFSVAELVGPRPDKSPFVWPDPRLHQRNAHNIGAWLPSTSSSNSSSGSIEKTTVHRLLSGADTRCMCVLVVQFFSLIFPAALSLSSVICHLP